ncbi:ankyrin repeat-containing domain protein [Aspergillus carlsbadensis]|nr:ankyrin repeat-containing domain protein [Aspergillus carlsbadensis]
MPDNKITPRDNLLLAAAHQGHMQVLEALIHESRSGREGTKAQLIPILDWAILTKNIELIDTLLAKDLPLRYINVNNGTNALGCAIVFNGETAIIERLLQANAKVQEPDYWLWCIAAREHGGAICNLLLKHGCRPRSDLVLLRLAVDNDQRAIDVVTNVEMNGLDIRVYGHMALSVAVANGHLDLVKHLIKKGANPHLRRPIGFPLHQGYSTVWVALSQYHFDVLEFLIKEQGVRPDKQDLQRAVDRGSAKAVELLSTFSFGAVPQKMDVSSYTAMMEDEHGQLDPEFQATVYWGLGDVFPIYYDPQFGWELEDTCEC